ncbi:cysteine--tRNA ligase [Candidatus Parcubacteria bacterium]|nr:cysteine--tRNA ligase [Candidatus Parcubacteria bacterium]
MLQLYNTLIRRIEPFKPLEDGKVGMYSCGPTVYNYVHLGNLRAYLFVDLLKRYLRYSGFEVKHVMNITDIDDKTIKGSQEAGKPLKEFTEFYFQAFLQDLESLNMVKPDVIAKATEHIEEIVNMIKRLEQNGYSYEINKSTYFRIAKFKNYGKLARLEKQSFKRDAEGRNIKDEYGKEEANDFALWKAWEPEHGDIYWDTEIGKGHPGWHIECSAMSTKYLGETFDIHTGGIDLIFPHHTNEIAQSEGATGKKFVNYWLHNGFLVVDGQKMSKSLHNFYTLRNIQEKGYNSLLVRLILLKTHYRQQLNFTFQGFNEAETIVAKFLDFLINLDFVENEKGNEVQIGSLIEESRNEFKKGMDDDLNISEALAAIFNFINEINKVIKSLNTKQAQKIKDYILEIDSVLGFIKLFYRQHQERLKELTNDSAVKELLAKRVEARKNKDYESADKLREELLKKGIIVNDVQGGYKVRLINVVENAN